MKTPPAKAACLSLVLFAATTLAADKVSTPNERTGPFILGADISWIPEDEAEGAEYFDHGAKKDIFEILKEHQFNYVRLRVFVNPQSTNGYARHRAEAFCDVEHTKVMASRAKAAGMGVLLNIHYGDNWTSPGHQDKPVAWQNLSFPELTNAVYEFTRHTVAALKANGTTPDMVQIGNEVSDGMLFPDGRRSKFDNFAALVKAGIAGVRAVDPAIKIMLHHHLGRHNERMREWIDNFLARGTEFDIIGMSCYAQAQEGDWKTNIDDLATRYTNHAIVVAEYSARKRFINDLVFNAPNQKGLGTFIWEPTRHREAIFDKDGRNAGGGQQSNFVNDEGINQGARRRGGTNELRRAGATPGTNVTARAAETNAPANAGPRRRSHGGRYDTNELIDLYPEMARAYGNDKFKPARP